MDPLASLAAASIALIGTHLQDRKKRTLMGAARTGWKAKTSYWPGASYSAPA